jgi:hypothetical protein
MHTSLQLRYCVGGGGSYAPGFELPYRDWDASYLTVDPLKAMYTVGKVDNRLDGPQSDETSGTNLEAIYQHEAPIITRLITNGLRGAVWEIGNEPNWRPYFMPAIYAAHYRRYEALIRGLDPSARLMIGGIANLLPYHDWINATGICPDIWSIHPYSWPISAAATIRSILDFREFRPCGTIWITEFSSGGWARIDTGLLCNYMHEVCSWLNINAEAFNIQRWFWWGVLSGDCGMGDNGLFSGNPYCAETITELGREYFRLAGAAVHKTFLPIVR